MKNFLLNILNLTLEKGIFLSKKQMVVIFRFLYILSFKKEFKQIIKIVYILNFLLKFKFETVNDKKFLDFNFAFFILFILNIT